MSDDLTRRAAIKRFGHAVVGGAAAFVLGWDAAGAFGSAPSDTHASDAPAHPEPAGVLPMSPAESPWLDYTGPSALAQLPFRLQYYLGDVGTKFGLFYTIESGSGPGLPWGLPTLKDPDLPADSPDSIEEAVRVLTERIPQAHFLLGSERRVLHIVDRALGAVPNYVMNRRGSLTFTGVPMDLPEKLGQRLDGALVMERSFAGEVILADFATPVSVVASHERVRDILTEAIPLQGYRGCIWSARTDKTSGSWRTAVQYYGPAVPIKVTRTAPGGVTDYGYGHDGHTLSVYDLILDIGKAGAVSHVAVLVDRAPDGSQRIVWSYPWANSGGGASRWASIYPAWDAESNRLYVACVDYRVNATAVPEIFVADPKGSLGPFPPALSYSPGDGVRRLPAPIASKTFFADYVNEIDADIQGGAMVIRGRCTLFQKPYQSLVVAYDVAKDTWTSLPGWSAP